MTTPELSRPLLAAAPVGATRLGSAGAAPAVSQFGLAATEPAPVTDLRPQPAAAMLSGRAVALVAIAIGIGIVGATVSWAFGHDDRLEPETYLRYVIVITLAVYVLVGGLIVTRLVPGVSLCWHRGQPARSILVGAVAGLALGGGLVWLATTASGHLSSDVRFVTLMSEGDVAHIVVSFGIAVVCAPLVEETLFRGLLLESLRARSAGAGLVASAVCFALWHLNIAVVPLVYYSLMGCMLGRIYMKRGLVGSMAAHAAFNGVLTVAALAIVLAPAKTLTSGDLSISAPGGWAQHDSSSGLVIEGPSESALMMVEIPAAGTPTTTTMLERIRAGLLSVAGVDLQADTGSAREVELPAGPAVEVDVVAKGHRGTLVFLPRPSSVVEVVFLSGGSMKARSDFPTMLDSLRVS